MNYRSILNASALGLLLMMAGITVAFASAQFSAADEQGRYTYLITFEESGLLEQHRQQRGSGSDFNFNAPATRAARDDLQAAQASHISDISSAISRSVQPTHYYLVSHSGIAARLTPHEARAVHGVPGVARIERERVYELDTYRGPEFIGAGSLWDGTGNPGGTSLLGEDMVAAILDTGIVASHPSFANDAACGHGVGGADDKLLSALDCSTTDGSGMCNGPDASDWHSHGSHVSGTVAGNAIDSSASPAPPVDISGVAPCARVRMYKVCPDQCPGAQTQAAMDSILVHGDVDVMNFSISGGRNPWSDNDRRKLDLVDAGIFVAASAGNTSEGVPNPFGQVNHLGPWVATVANSSHDGLLAHTVTVAGTLGPIAGLPGSGPDLGADFNGQIRWAGDVDGANVEGCSAFAGGSFTGDAALISRGTCAFADKVNNAVAAGATYVMVYNNIAGAPIVMGGLEATTVASSMVSLDDGNAIIAEIGGATASVLVESGMTAFSFPDIGDILSAGSLVGPTPSPVQDLQKPDITGPGTSIFAPGNGASGYTLMSGTSMSSPHLAGAAVLMHQAHPDWTPVEVKSAIMMTASKTGSKPAGAGPWDADDVGSGRADLSVAAQAGLVMHETFANFLAANPGTGGDVRTVNVPSVRDMACTPNCTFTRTVRNTLDVASSWTASGSGTTASMGVSISPSTFSFTGDTSETQELTITVTPQEDLTSSIGFGEVVLTEDSSLSPELHLTVAISGEPGGPAIEVAQEFFDFVMNADSTSSQTLNIANTGAEPLNWTIETEDTTAGARSPREFDGDFDIANWTLVNTPAGVNGSFNTNAGPPIELFVIGGDDGVGGSTDFEITVPANGEISFDWGYESADSADFDDAGYVINGTYTELANTDAQVPFFNSSETVAVSAGDVFAFRSATDDGTFGSGDLGVTNFEFAPAVCDNVGAIGWLSMTPDNGTTAAGDDDDVSVDIDTTGLADGVYEANLCITSDATNESLVVVPVTVTVQAGTIDPPTIDAAPLSFSYNLTAGETDGDDLTISNLGDELLSWNIATAEAAGAGHFPQGSNIVVYDNIDFTPNVDFTGGAVEWFTGTTCDCDTIPYDLNIWTSGGNIAFFWPVDGEPEGGVSLDGGTTYGVLQPGDTVGSGDTFIAGGGTDNWRDAGNVEGYLGFQFENPDTSVTNYGYAHISATGTTGHPFTIHGWAFDQTGADIEIVTGGPVGCDNPATVPWLSVDPVSGSTTGGSNSIVAVSVDSTGLEGGIYEALLCVSSNDPATPLVEIPVTLDVTDPPEIDVDPTSISLSMQSDTIDSANVTITNLGEATLDWAVDESPSANGSVLRAGSATVPATVPAQPSAGLANSAQSMSVKPASGLAIGDLSPLGGGGTVLTHSASQAITPANAVACSPDGGTTTSDNAFLRTFTLGDFGIAGAFDVSEVSFGIESLSIAADVTVNLYSLDGAFTYGNMTLLGTTTQNLASQSETIVAMPVSGTVPAGGTLVVEIVPEDLSGTGAFFPGSNSAGETAPSYLASAGCGLNEPGTYDSIGFPQVQLVMNVTGGAGFDCALPGWISNVAPLSGSLAQTASDVMTVTLDSTGLSPATYNANVCLSSNDPVTPVTVIPVELEVELGPNDSQLTGTVTSLGYCSDDPSLVEGAAIEVVGDSGAIFNTTTDVNGEWEVVLDTSETPVDITASAADHVTGEETGVTLVGGTSTVVDFDLVLEEPCAQVAPASFSDVFAPGDTGGNYVMTIDNTLGGDQLVWGIQEASPSVGYGYDLEGAGELVNNTGGARGSETLASERPATASPFVDAGIQGAPIASNFNEAFDDVTVLPGAGWSLQNLSDPLGTTDWFQGAPDTFPAHEGDPDAYIGANFNNTTGGTGIISNWLMTPEVELRNGTELRFWTRVPSNTFPDRLEVRLSTSGSSTFAGAAATDVGDFDTVMLSIDENLEGTYPVEWTEFVATVSGLPETTSGRFAFRYFVTDAGPSGDNSNFIGIDTVSVAQPNFCQDPSDVPWLNVSPFFGATDAGDSTDVDVSVDASGLDAGSYDAFICVSSNDTEAELIQVPFSIEVLGDGIFQDRFEG